MRPSSTSGSASCFSTPQIANTSVLVALYWLALDGRIGELAAAAVVIEAGALMAAVRWSPTEIAKYWIGLTGLGVAAGAFGITIRQRRALVASLQETAARLEFERDQQGRLGAAAERARIAREMHDIVSHNLTVMFGLADGAGYALQSSPQTTATAIERVSATGRQALAEMRRLLGVLREEPESEPFDPQPTARDPSGAVAVCRPAAGCRPPVARTRRNVLGSSS
jgi:signal transduction histidine kinase